MRRQILIYGLVGGLLIALLKWSEYRFLVVEHSLEIYGGLVAAAFSAVGIWLGMKLTAKPPKRVVETVIETVVREVPRGPFVANETRRTELEITPREFEILGLIAQGLSNREIAEKLFVSENTVKTHASRVLDKLGAKRRTQAVLRGKELGLLP